ncbi:MAG: hypothetical protein M0Z41_09910 [Peptococcaceae bacterium]|nr:hypothetical protein [Peptococcaceae bacterium]
MSQLSSRLLVGVAAVSALVAVVAQYRMGSSWWAIATGALAACLLGVASGED